MVWILVWLQLSAGQSMQFYHIDTFSTVDECVEELRKAVVLKNHKNTAIDCLPVQTTREVKIEVK